MSREHTKTPWKWVPEYNVSNDTGDHRGSIRIKNHRQDGGFICAIDEIGEEGEAHANAEFIVKAVNSYDGMLDLLKDLHRQGIDCDAGNGHRKECLACWVSDIVAKEDQA